MRRVPGVAAVWLLLAALLPVGLACASLEGARLYASGSAALERGETSRAIADLERAALRVPHGSQIHNHLGLSYLQAGRLVDARAAFERALAIDCDNAAARTNLRVLETRRADAP